MKETEDAPKRKFEDLTLSEIVDLKDEIAVKMFEAMRRIRKEVMEKFDVRDVCFKVVPILECEETYQHVYIKFPEEEKFVHNNRIDRYDEDDENIMF